MFDHVTIRASDRSTSERFYQTVLPSLGIEQTHRDRDYVEWDDFSLAQADTEHQATRRLHVGFVAHSREHVDEFWRVGTRAGYRSDGEPGLRPQYSEDYYGAFLLDPDGNSVEAVHHGSLRRGGNVDHLWIRVSDVDAATRFYETISPAAGFRVGSELAGRTRFACRLRARPRRQQRRGGEPQPVRPRLTHEGASRRGARERQVGLEADDEAARWLEEHDPAPPPPESKSARKSKTLHRWRKRQQRP